jgi:hypothetical protein
MIRARVWRQLHHLLRLPGGRLDRRDRRGVLNPDRVQYRKLS